MWPLKRKKQIKSVSSGDKSVSIINMGLFDTVNSLLRQKIYPSTFTKINDIKDNSINFTDMNTSELIPPPQSKEILAKTNRKKIKKISNSQTLKLITPQHFFDTENGIISKWRLIGDFTNKQRKYVYIHFLNRNSVIKNLGDSNRSCRKQYIEFKVYNTDRFVIEYLLNKKSFTNEKAVFLIFKKLCELKKIQHFLKNSLTDFNPEFYQIDSVKYMNSQPNDAITIYMKHILYIINSFWKKFKSQAIYILEELINEYNLFTLININDLKATIKLLKSKVFWMKCDAIILLNLKFNILENFLNEKSKNTENFKEEIDSEELLAFNKHIIDPLTESNLSLFGQENYSKNEKKIKVENEDEYFDFLLSFNSSIDSYTQNINLLHNEITNRDKLLDGKDEEIHKLQEKLQNRKEKYNLFI